jgi:hypothetical protein
MQIKSKDESCTGGSGLRRSFNPARVGSLHSVTGATGGTTSGVRAKNPAAKSSTMKGANKSACESVLMKTVPNREQPPLTGKGALLVSAPRNRTVTCGNYALPGGGDIRCGLEVGPPSNVIVRAMIITKPGAPCAAALVMRCLKGNEVIEKHKAGRVASVGAASRESGKLARLLQGSGRLVPVFGWLRARRRTTKERTGKTRHQQHPLLVQ